MEAAEKLSVTVTPAMARMIREKVDQGEYGSASEVVRAALRALQRDEEEHAERIAAIKARIEASINDPRPSVPADVAFHRIRERISEMAVADDQSAARRAK